MSRIHHSATVVHKFGENTDIDAGVGLPEDIWDGGGAYTFPSAAAATTLVSTSTDDAAAETGARTVRVMGLDANWADIAEDVTVTGTDAVALDADFLRVYRAYVLTAGTGEVNAGTITIAIGGTAAAIITAGMSQTLMAIFSTAAEEWWDILSWFASLSGKNAAYARLALQTRTDGGAWRTRMTAEISEANSINYEWPVPFVVPPKTDIRIRALDVSANDTSVSSTFGMKMIQGA